VELNQGIDYLPRIGWGTNIMPAAAAEGVKRWEDNSETRTETSKKREPG